MKLPLSIAIIASNERDNIERCLRSIVSVASEIVLVENDTTDDTCTLAEQFGARIFHEPWRGFSEQKNYAIDRTTQPWILCLDADEEVDDELLRSIQRFIQSNDPRYDGAYFSRRTFFLNRWIKHGDWSPDHVARLFRSGRGRWSDDPVHERLIVAGRTKKLAGHLLHYSYRSVRDHMYKNLKYAELSVHNGRSSCLCVVIRSFWKFFRGYFIKLGILDGFAGFYIAYTQSMFTLYKHILSGTCPRGKGFSID